MPTTPTINGSGAHQVNPGGLYPGTRSTRTSERTLPRSIVNSSERAPACAARDPRSRNPANDTPRRSLPSRRSRRSPTASELASAPGDDRSRSTIGYDCSSGADDTQNGATTKSPRTPWNTVMTKPNTQTGSSVPISSQSTADSRCRGRGGAGGGRDAVATEGARSGVERRAQVRASAPRAATQRASPNRSHRSRHRTSRRARLTPRTQRTVRGARPRIPRRSGARRGCRGCRTGNASCLLLPWWTTTPCADFGRSAVLLRGVVGDVGCGKCVAARLPHLPQPTSPISLQRTLATGACPALVRGAAPRVCWGFEAGRIAPRRRHTCALPNLRQRLPNSATPVCLLSPKATESSDPAAVQRVVHGLDDDRDLNLAAERQTAVRAGRRLCSTQSNVHQRDEIVDSTVSMPLQSPTHDGGTCSMSNTPAPFVPA